MPPPLKMMKPMPSSEPEDKIEELLVENGFLETLAVFRMEKNKRTAPQPAEPTEIVAIEKRGDLWCCMLCDKTFTTKGSAKRHLVSAHSADSKQFECPKCSAKFSRRDDLYTHLRRMHGAHKLVDSMIEEHKAELKSEHKGDGKGKLMVLLSHNEHLDIVLPSGTTICRPFATDTSSQTAKEPIQAAKACRSSPCQHWRVIHDDHEDVLVNGALHHKNEEGEWEYHGELGSLEDFEFLLSASGAVEQGSEQQCLVHPPQQDLSLDDIDFLLSSTTEPITPKPCVESLLLPGGSVLCRHVSTEAPRFEIQEEHKHALNCGHPRMRHGNHYDYIVKSVVESDKHECPMHGTTVLENADSTALNQVVSALNTEMSSSSSNNMAAVDVASSSL